MPLFSLWLATQDSCSFGHLRIGKSLSISPILHTHPPLSNLLLIHYYFQGFARLRISFELIIAFLDVNQVLLLILKNHRPVNNLKFLSIGSVSKLVFKVDNISFGYILCYYCTSSFKHQLDSLIFTHTCMYEGEAKLQFVG